MPVLSLVNNFSIFDTHCHLADEKYEGQDIKKILQEAEKVGIKNILNVGYDKASNQKVIEQLAKFPHLFVALGLHPNSNEDLKEENLQ
jgi:TatD DNase family protein